MTAVIFDLDNCLTPAEEVGEELFAPAFAAIRAANDGSLTTSALTAAFDDMRRHAYDWVARTHAFTSAMLAAGWQALSQVEVTGPMHGYPDLGLLNDVPAERFLVTSGIRRIQESKVRALGVGPLFTEVRIDAIDAPSRQGKLGLFLEIIGAHHLSTREVVVVGDNAESELAAGKALGLRAVQLLRSGVVTNRFATAHVHDLRGLISMLRSNARLA
jgi:putative hydrolase of the HAD superfamily